MKINGTHLPPKLSVYQTVRVQGQSANTRKYGASTLQQDRVALSEQGRLIADAQLAAKELPDIRETLVTQIQNELDSGSYVFDNYKTAEGILRESMVNQAAMF